MKNQALFSSKDKSTKFKMSSAAIFVRRFKSYASSYVYATKLFKDHKRNTVQKEKNYVILSPIR